MEAAHGEAWTAFYTAHLALKPAMDRALRRAVGIGMDEYGVLLHLEMAEGSRLRMGEISEVVGLTPSGATRLVDRLERAGLVRRVVCPNDRRAMHCALTPLGHERRLAAWEVYRGEIEARFAALYDEEEAAALRDLLRRLGDRWRAFTPTGASDSPGSSSPR